jgi:hypothetical protein
MTAEIIDFKTKKQLNQKSEVELDERMLEQQSRDFANSLVDDYMVRLIHEFQSEGMGIGSTNWEESKKTFKEIGFFIEALRALIHKEFDLKHPMQQIIDRMMKIKYDKRQDKYYSQIQYYIPRETEKTVEFEGEELE